MIKRHAINLFQENYGNGKYLNSIQWEFINSIQWEFDLR
jgi:hypothetical protein